MTSRRQIRVIAGVLLAAAAAAGAGCGGSTGPVSAAELISQGDDLCAEERTRYREIQTQAPKAASDAVEQTEELIDVAEETLDGLTEIEPPSDLSAAYDRYLDARRQSLELLERGREAAERHDRRAYGDAVEESEAGEARREKLARAVGFEVCGRP